jgi:hypothetical protein
LGLPDPDPIVRGKDPDPAMDPENNVIVPSKQKKQKQNILIRIKMSLIRNTLLDIFDIK